jgi:hypothetical protein
VNAEPLDQPAKSIELLSERCRSIPAALSYFSQQVKHIRWPTLPQGKRWLVTGIGGSEGPARYLVTLLQEQLGVHALFVPLSSFKERTPQADILVVFSQNLSSNAQICLKKHRSYQHTVIITAVQHKGSEQGSSQRAALLQALKSEGIQVLNHPPLEENGFLFRWIGPCLAAFCSLHFVQHLAQTWADSLVLDIPEDLPERYAQALEQLVMPLGPPYPVPLPLALVSEDMFPERYQSFTWKILEALLCPQPPVWDILQLAHGPFQQWYEQPMTLLGLQHTSTHESKLFSKLETLLVPERHRLVYLTSTLPAHLAWFEHDAHLNAWVLATLQTNSYPLRSWPGQGKDQALYCLSD